MTSKETILTAEGLAKLSSAWKMRNGSMKRLLMVI